MTNTATRICINAFAMAGWIAGHLWRRLEGGRQTIKLENFMAAMEEAEFKIPMAI